MIYLLNSVEAVCDDVAFKVFGHFSLKPQRDQLQSVTSDVEAAYERDGEKLCDAFYARLGPGGDLVKYVRRVRDEEGVGDQLQVLWRSKEICDRPGEFWGAGFGSAPTDAGAVKAVCEKARK